MPQRLLDALGVGGEQRQRLGAGRRVRSARWPAGGCAPGMQAATPRGRHHERVLIGCRRGGGGRFVRIDHGTGGGVGHGQGCVGGAALDVTLAQLRRDQLVDVRDCRFLGGEGSAGRLAGRALPAVPDDHLDAVAADLPELRGTAAHEVEATAGDHSRNLLHCDQG